MKRRKQTPGERLTAARAKWEAARIAADKEYEATVDNIAFSDLEKTMRAHDINLNLSPEERLEILKSLDAWPRIVLGVYEAERAIAENNPDKAGEPSDIAYEIVGKYIGVGDDRVKALCNEGRQQIREGRSNKFKANISVAELKKFLRDLSVAGVPVLKKSGTPR
jgi:hypothetical protein